jgi:hypothetical protein
MGCDFTDRHAAEPTRLYCVEETGAMKNHPGHDDRGVDSKLTSSSSAAERPGLLDNHVVNLGVAEQHTYHTAALDQVARVLKDQVISQAGLVLAGVGMAH